jgi:hypothetical protein
MLHKVGVEIASLTFDGAAANLSMAHVLGADFSNFQKLNQLNTSCDKLSFLHYIRSLSYGEIT